MSKIIYLSKEVKIGEVITYQGLEVEVTQTLIDNNPDTFKVIDERQELLDKAKRDYPIGTMFNSKYGIQKVLGDNPFIGIGIPGTIQINTDRFTGGATIYTPEDGWAEILPLKFTTEDGVDIYGDMKTYAVGSSETEVEDDPETYEGNSLHYKYFYHKKNALAYIEKHKEKSLEYYENILLQNTSTLMIAWQIVEKCDFYKVLKELEPKLYYDKVLQLIADDLNDGYKPDFDDHTSYHLSDRLGGINNHCGGDEGCVYFKSIELAKKAKSILGENVKYLFN